MPAPLASNRLDVSVTIAPLRIVRSKRLIVAVVRNTRCAPPPSRKVACAPAPVSVRFLPISMDSVKTPELICTVSPACVFSTATPTVAHAVAGLRQSLASSPLTPST
ncbi:MAG: hypothetical protein R2873_09400 [Caldilineaceae bacterium]